MSLRPLSMKAVAWMVSTLLLLTQKEGLKTLEWQLSLETQASFWEYTAIEALQQRQLLRRLPYRLQRSVRERSRSEEPSTPPPSRCDVEAHSAQ